MATRSTRARKPPPMPQPEQQPRAKWTTPLTKILVDLMVEQVHVGNRTKKSFDKKGWEYICDEFYKKTGLKWEKEQLKSKHTALRKLLSIVNALLDHDDFKWDEITEAIVASDEAWDRYIKEHPDAETIRTSGCPIYKQLCTIFSEYRGANGDINGLTGHKQEKLQNIPCPKPLRTFQELSSSSESDEDADVANDLGKYQSTAPPNLSGSKRGRKGVDDAIAKAILEMAAASKLRAIAMKQYKERFSITSCVKALDEIKGVDDRVYYAALDLFNNPTRRETFLSLKADKRLAWLSAKCRAVSDS